MVQVGARICRFCRFNFETGIGVDGVERGVDVNPVIEPASTGVRKPPLHVRASASRSFALESAWKQLEAGQVKFVLDQGFEAVKTARDSSTLANLAALAAAAAAEANFRARLALSGSDRCDAVCLDEQLGEGLSVVGADLVCEVSFPP
ncbi:MAG: hypothetical protein LH654_15995, partial [Thermoleophilia bacterium]|nr:hypothetical protein [Thermoleophilia bacterium]